MKVKKRTIIVEDELPVREEIILLTSQRENLEIVGVGNNGDELEELLDQKNPDLAILDIELPVKDTLSVLSGRKRLPQIIFISAYKKYSLNAFEFEAVDFLVKPIKEEHFIKAVSRAVVRINSAKRNISQGKKADEIFWIREGDKVIPIPVNEIVYIEADDKKTKMYLCENRCFAIPRSFSSILQQLESANFLQIHRKYAVKVSNILEMHKMFHSSYEITLKGTDKKLQVSHRYGAAFNKINKK